MRSLFYDLYTPFVKEAYKPTDSTYRSASVTLSPSFATPIYLDEHIRPMLLVVIDTEEEFDWSAPFSRSARSTKNIREQRHAQKILDRHGATPLYVIDYPVASDPWSAGWLREAADDGRAEIGSHLHTWVTPPFEETVSPANSYGCNLDPALERAKIDTLTEHIAAKTGYAPKHFRAGRYGVGYGTLRTLRELGYRTDMSIAPHSNFRSDGGPSFYGWNNEPYWHGKPGGLLGIPVTTGFSGHAKGWGPAGAPILDNLIIRSLKVPGALAGLGLLDRCRLTIEDVPGESLKRTIQSLVREGQRVLTLSYHSSTLLPGATSYARNEAERDALLVRLDETLEFFTEVLGGRLVSASTADEEIRTSENLEFSNP